MVHLYKKHPSIRGVSFWSLMKKYVDERKVDDDSSEQSKEAHLLVVCK